MLLSIDELRKQLLASVESETDLKTFVYKQQELLEKHMQENKELKEKLNHCEKLLKSTPTLLQPNDEEFICVQQIQMIKERSLQRELDINDVKKLDLLIKNLRLIRSQPTDITDSVPRDVTPEDLIAIATKTE